jgi:hypothetical protein
MNKDSDKKFAQYSAAVYDSNAVLSATKLWSNGEVQLFEEESKYVVAFRGTQSLNDALDDAAMVASVFSSMNTTRFLRNQSEMSTALQRYAVNRRKNVYLTGHSLGGAIAAFCMEQNNPRLTYAFIFNAPGGKIATYSRFLPINIAYPKLKITHFYIDSDPVSTIRDPRVKQVVLPKKSGMNAHTINQFL